MGYVVYGLAAAAALGLLLAFNAPMLMLDRLTGIDLTNSILLVPLLGAGVGLSVGVLQAYVIRQRLRWTAPHWLKASTLGGVVGVLLLSFLPNVELHALQMLVFITAISVCQWWVLRGATRYASLWVLANGVAALVYTQIVLWHIPLLTLLAPLVQAGITGAVLILLFERFSYPIVRTNRRRATLPDMPDRRPSVWDNAI